MSVRSVFVGQFPAAAGNFSFVLLLGSERDRLPQALAKTVQGPVTLTSVARSPFIRLCNNLGWGSLTWIRGSVAAGQFKELVQYVRREIDSVTAEEAWYDRWRQQGSLPDYSGVRDGLRGLLNAGRADDVVALGRRLFRKAQEQVGMSHDDGETAAEVADTMKIVYQALLQCSLSDTEKMETAVDFELEDEFELCSESV